MLKTFLAVLAFIFLCIEVGEFGEAAQLYDTIPARGYATIYYEFSTRHEQLLMLWAAEWRCEGDLQTNFECKGVT